MLYIIHQVRPEQTKEVGKENVGEMLGQLKGSSNK